MMRLLFLLPAPWAFAIPPAGHSVAVFDSAPTTRPPLPAFSPFTLPSSVCTVRGSTPNRPRNLHPPLRRSVNLTASGLKRLIGTAGADADAERNTARPRIFFPLALGRYHTLVPSASFSRLSSNDLAQLRPRPRALMHALVSVAASSPSAAEMPMGREGDTNGEQAGGAEDEALHPPSTGPPALRVRRSFLLCAYCDDGEE
ncbi:hypothetical protein B0H16DRAFT_1716725 [Mycena metata]|uniref:Uncharacterized protein n=1 Tax=Mycena metata TaxID=1033252 RepID=A0AAD7JM82_9AGAR|nr:hypothetical protein B0H16DRAFT_1716725 [Mycena metata]